MMKHYCAIFLIVTLGVRNCVGGCSDEVEYHSERCDIFNRFRAVTDRVINLEEAKWKHEEKINALTISLGQKENQINELNNKDELKDKTIQLLYKQVEKLTISLDEKEEQINKLIFNDELKNDTIQLLTTLVDELQRRNAPRSCSVLKKQGIVRDQETYLDFDGQNFGRPPFLGKCLFASGETSLGMETTINITRCGDQAKCFQQDILLDEELLTEIDNAINHFPTCSQDWEFRSSSALLNDPVNHEPLLFWKDRMGNTTNFLEAEDHDTINGEKRFRGSVTQTTKLPITGVIYDGPLSSGLAQITIKSVKCLSETNEVPPLEERFHQSVKTTNEKINKINTDIEEAKSELKNDFEMELNDTKTDLQSKIKTKASKAELQIKMETKVSTSAYESKISSLEASVRTKVSTSTYNPKITALESLIGTKISTSSYNRKISSLESSIAPIGTIIAWVPRINKYSNVNRNLPDGWLYCDGSRIKKGPWTGGVTPDLNAEGRFLRGGSPDQVLTMQDDSFQQHIHSIIDNEHSHSDYGHKHSDGGHTHGVLDYSTVWGKGAPKLKHGYLLKEERPNQTTKKGYANIQTGYASISSSKSGIRIGGSTHAKSGTETRPINMKVIWIMKCW